MIVCLFGASCVGKTTIARQVSAAMGLPLRCCGEAVRSAAVAAGIELDDLTDDDHRAVDAQTVAWALEQGACLIEGRFLDAVFANVTRPVMLVLLMAAESCRIKRGQARNGSSTFSAEDLRQLDAEDAAFRARMFGERGGTTPWRVFDTSGRTVDTCVQMVMTLIQAGMPEPPV